MANQRNSNPVYNFSTNVVFSLSSVFGISPLVIVKGKFRIGYFLLCYCIAAILATFTLGYASKNDVARRFNDNTVEAFMTLIAATNSATHVLKVCSSCFTFGRLNILLKKIQAVDAVLSQNSIKNCLPGDRFNGWLEINLISFYWINYGFDTKFENMDNLFFCISATYFALISAEFLIFGNYLLSRFKTIVCSLSVHQSPEKLLDKLIATTLVHSRLCDAQNDLNSIYSLRFPLLALTVLLYTTSRLHVTYNVRDFARISFIYRINFLFFYWIIFLRVVACADTIARKSKQFNEILYQMMIEDKTKRLLANNKLQLHISMKKEVVFTACGLFNMDYTLVHSVIAAATTYVAILVQFQNPPAAVLPSTTVPNNTTKGY